MTMVSSVAVYILTESCEQPKNSWNVFPMTELIDQLRQKVMREKVEAERKRRVTAELMPEPKPRRTWSPEQRARQSEAIKRSYRGSSPPALVSRDDGEEGVLSRGGHHVEPVYADNTPAVKGYLPPDIEESANLWLDDPEAASLRRQIAIANARLDQLLAQVPKQTTEHDKDVLWEKIRAMMREIKGYSESELRRTLAIRASIPVEDFRILWSDALAVIEANVSDEPTRRAIDAGFARIGQLALKGHAPDEPVANDDTDS